MIIYRFGKLSSRKQEFSFLYEGGEKCYMVQIKMKKELSIILIIICICSLCGCTKTPDQVKKNTKNYNKESSDKESKYSFDKVSLEHILDHKDQVLEKQYSNIKMPKTISATIPDQLYNLTLSTQKDYTKKKDQLMELYFNTGKYNNKMKFNEMSLDIYHLNLDEKNAYAYIYDNGMFFWIIIQMVIILIFIIDKQFTVLIVEMI